MKKKGRLFFFEKKKQKTFVCLVLVVSACSSPDPNYYTLAATQGAPITTPARIIEVARPSLAGYLDRSGIVLQQTGYKLNVNTIDVWAEPLADMIGRVLTQDLAQRLPASQIFDAGGAIATDPDLRVEADIQQFDASPSGTVTLSATVAIEQHHISLSTRTVRLTTTANPGAAPLAAALSLLLGNLSDQIATEIATHTAPK
jgi:uncharacterized lipoprotein YmbA